METEIKGKKVFDKFTKVQQYVWKLAKQGKKVVWYLAGDKGNREYVVGWID